MINLSLRFIIQLFFDLLYFIIQLDQYVTRKRIHTCWQKMQIPQHGPEDYEAQKIRLENYFSSLEGNKWWVQTSGTSQEPKKIPYDEKRISELNKAFLKSMIVLTSEFKGPKTFFAFGSLNKDQSLTSSMVDESNRPSRLELLQAPYRYLATPEGNELRNLTGDSAARTAVLIVTKPRFIYATNPSTLTHFIDELQQNWPEIQTGLRKLIANSEILNCLLQLQDGDGKARLISFMEEKAFNLSKLLTELKAVITWDGGYVKTFLDRLMHMLPKEIKHLPMYSMSTETIETLPHRVNGQIKFLPTMKNTLPEFLDDSGKILKPSQLRTNSIYTLLITNRWGMERYDTQDEFKVMEMIDDLPALKFMRRRNVTASLTGEKITEVQALLMQKMLKDKYRGLSRASLSLFPVVNGSQAGYQMVIIGESINISEEITQDAESYLSQINNEYRDKVKSGRLLPIQLRIMSVRELASLMGQENRWESQFKVMPLYEKPVTKNS